MASWCASDAAVQGLLGLVELGSASSSAGLIDLYWVVASILVLPRSNKSFFTEQCKYLIKVLFQFDHYFYTHFCTLNK